jgi:hypothetical protein
VASSAEIELHALKIDLFLRQQGLDTTTPAGKAMFQMMGLFAEFERAMIAERVRAGLARARGEGKRLGRPPIAPALEKRIREALATPGRPGCPRHRQTVWFNPGTVQRISRPFEQDAVALRGEANGSGGRLDSERFSSTPRTCGRFRCTLSLR